MRVLVADPNMAFATLLQEELRRQGYEVVGASTCAESLDQARAGTLDLALLDMALDEPGAVALGQQLRELHPTLRLMLIPLMGESLAPEVATSLAIQGILPKPFFLPELPERIGAALRAPLVPLDIKLTEETLPPPSAPEAPPRACAFPEAPGAGRDGHRAESAGDPSSPGVRACDERPGPGGGRRCGGADGG